VHRRSAPTVTQPTIRVRAGDGGRLSGIAVPALAPLTFVVAHGFTNSVSAEPFGRSLGWLRRFGDARAVVTIGLSMGGGAALRQAAVGEHRPDAVVSVSAVSARRPRRPLPLEHFRTLAQAAGPAATVWVVPAWGTRRAA
jgi:hypothetical protein